MKKIPTKWIVAVLAGVFLVCGTITTALVFGQVIPNITGEGGNRVPYNESFELELNEGDELLLSVPTADIYVVTHDGAALTATFEGTVLAGREDTDKLVAERSGRQTKIAQESDSKRVRLQLFSFGPTGGGNIHIHGKLTVNIPRHQLNRVEVSTLSGEISLAGVSGRELTVNTASGGIALDGVRMDGALVAESFSGDIRVTRSTAGGAADIDTSSGLATLTDCDFGALDVNTFSGDVIAARVAVSGDVSLGSGSGGIEADTVTSAGFSAKAFSGDVKVANLSAAGTARLENSSGDVDVNVARAQGMDITTFSGGAELWEIELGEGGFRADSSSGRVAVRWLVARTVDIKTFSGGVELDGVFADSVVAESSSGPLILSLDEAADIDCDTFSGVVELELPADMGFALNFDTFSGKLSGGFPGLPANSQSVETTVGAGARRVDVTTSSGDLRISAR